MKTLVHPADTSGYHPRVYSDQQDMKISVDNSEPQSSN